MVSWLEAWAEGEDLWDRAQAEAGFDGCDWVQALDSAFNDVSRLTQVVRTGWEAPIVPRISRSSSNAAWGYALAEGLLGLAAMVQACLIAVSPPAGPVLRRRPVGPMRFYLLVVSFALGGCNCLRLEAGIGPTLGADIHLSGLIYTGAIMGVHVMTGTIYGEDCDGGSFVLTVPGFHLDLDGLVGHGGAIYYHTNFGVLPPLTGGRLFTERGSHPWAFEMTLGLVFLVFCWFR